MGLLTKSNNKNQACIDACNHCEQSCYECFDLCLLEQDVANRVDCLKALIECAVMCQMSVTLLSLKSQSAMDHCTLCANVCQKCAMECEAFDDLHCKDCVTSAKKCATECNKVESW